MGRTAQGVRGISLKTDQSVISMLVLAKDESDGTILSSTERGYGKRTPISDYPRHRRGGQGVISIQTEGRNGDVTGALKVADADEVMLISDGGTLIRTRVNEISTMSRNTQGVRLINLSDEEALISISKVEEDQAGNGDDEAPESEETNPIN